jgi:hypothetical protein
MMKIYISTLLLLLFFNKSFAQTDSSLIPFENRQYKLNHNGMIILSSWGGANLVSGAIGYGVSDKFEDQQFHLMNAAWGAINLGIALPSVFNKQKRTASFFDLQKKQTTFEKLFLANALLDVVYITGGTCLTQVSKNQTDTKLSQRFNAYGNSIIIQGAGLLIFDTFMTLLHNKNRKHHLDPRLKNATFSFSGNSVRLGYRFN